MSHQRNESQLFLEWFPQLVIFQRKSSSCPRSQQYGFDPEIPLGIEMAGSATAGWLLLSTGIPHSGTAGTNDHYSLGILTG